MVAFVLSGGASHGAVHVGMLRALIEAGVEPDALFGTSVGAVNASVIAHVQDSDRLDVLTAAWHDFAKRPPIRPSLARNALAVLARRRALSDLSPLRARLEETFGGARIENAAIPLFVTATNLRTGRERLFERGDLLQALMASCAVPGLFPPVEIDGVPYIDGLLYGAPVRAAVERGHDTLYLLLTNSTLPAHELPATWWGIARRAATMIMWNQLTVPDCAGEVAIHTVPAPPSMATVGRWDFSRTKELLADSYETAARWVAELPRGEELVS
jgi:NTE family protein